VGDECPVAVYLTAIMINPGTPDWDIARLRAALEDRYHVERKLGPAAWLPSTSQPTSNMTVRLP
jgi:hypothetical protein